VSISGWLETIFTILLKFVLLDKFTQTNVLKIKLNQILNMKSHKYTSIYIIFTKKLETAIIVIIVIIKYFCNY